MGELYGLPEGWEWTRLEELTEVNLGKTPTRSKKEYFLGDKVWLSIRDLKGDYVSSSNEGLTDDAIKASNIKIVLKGTLLMSFKLTLGRTAFADCDLYTNEAIASLPIKNDSTLDKYFLKYALGAIDLEKEVDNAVKGKTLNKQKLKNLDIPLPPLQEQKRIVAKLDSLFAKIDQAITLHQQNIDEADALMGSALNEVFGELDTNKKISLKDITTKIGSGSTPRGGQKAYKTEGISLIRSMNVHDAGFRTKGLAFIDDEQAKKLNNVTIEENDVLLNITGASVARCCIVDKAYLPARVNQHVSIIRLKEDMLPKFLHYYLISPSVKADLLFGSSGGATREAITKSMLESFEVPFIPIETQQKTVQYLDQLSQKIETLKQVQTQKMESLKALKASILDQAFRGEI